MATPELLHYRPWTGAFRPPGASVWPIARTALGLMFRRPMFWVLYVLSLGFFLLFFFGRYLLAYFETLAPSASADAPFNFLALSKLIRNVVDLDGSGKTYRAFISLQGYMVMIVLVLAGTILIGNDLRFGSLPYYLSKPLSRRHYVLGKGLAVAVFVNLMTTVPAVVLFLQFGLLDSWSYFIEKIDLLGGIFVYGAVLTIGLCPLLLASAMWLRRTVPIIMLWTTLFVFFRFLSGALVRFLNFPQRFRLFDLWNDMYLVGNRFLTRDAAQPAWYEAALVVVGVNFLCLIYLTKRIRGVEIVK
jgi:hypothetical protein